VTKKTVDTIRVIVFVVGFLLVAGAVGTIDMGGSLLDSLSTAVLGLLFMIMSILFQESK